MFTLQNKLLTSTEIIEQGFQLYRRSLSTTLPYSLASVVCIFAPQYLQLLDSQLTLNSIVWTIASCWILGMILLSSLIFHLYCFLCGISNNFLHSLKHSLFKLFSLLMLCVLFALIILSSTMLLIVPGVILAVSLMFSFILVIISNENVLQTLISSHRLVWGHWWHTLFIISIPLVLNISLSLTLYILLITILTLIGLTTLLYFTLLLTCMVIQVFFIPLTVSIALVLLQDLQQKILRFPRW